MALNFPNSPSTNDIYTINGYSWIYDGSKWKALDSKQPIDNNLFAISGSMSPGSLLATDGSSVYWTTTTLSTNSQTGTSYNLLLSDQGYIVEMSNSSANSVTIPPNSSVAFPIGTQVTVIQTGTGQTSITSGAGVTINCTPQSVANTATLRAQWSSVQLIKRATNTWIVIGDLV